MTKCATTLMCIAVLCVLMPMHAMARTRTTQKSLRNASAIVEALPLDSVAVAESGINPNAVTLRGYSKRASDSKESFFITNNTAHSITSVNIMLRYTTMSSQLLHERTVTLPVTLKAGQSQLVSIKSWDVQRLFYHYAGPKPRKSATPYKVAFRLTGYAIPVGN